MAEEKFYSLMATFLEENRRRDEENRRRDEENRKREEEMRTQILEDNRKREEVFAELIRSMKFQSSGPVSMVRNKPDLVPELMRQISEFSHDPESGRTFSKWIDRFEAVMISHGTELSDPDKTQALVSKLDLQSYGSFTDHILPKTTKDLTYDETKEILESLFGDKVSVFRRRFDMFRLVIGDLGYSKLGSTINRMTALAQVEQMSKEHFKCLVFVSALQGARHADIRTRLLRKLETQEECTLADLVKECEFVTSLKIDSDVIDNVQKVNAVKQMNRKKPRPGFPSKDIPRSSTKGNCFICGSPEHFRKDCPKNQPKAQQRKNKAIKKIVGNVVANRRYTEVNFGDTQVRMQLDSGADVTLINKETWEQIGSPALERSMTTLGAANGSPIKVLGQFDVKFTCGGHSGHGRCYVADKVEQLLGIEWMNQLQKLQKAFNAICCKIEQKPKEEGEHLASSLSECFPDVFKEELGKCQTKAQLFVKQGTRPIFCRQRKIPFAREEAVNVELERLVQQGVLKKVDYSNWAAPIVVVAKKNGAVRICADFKTGLNDALEMHRHPLPVPD